MNCVCFGGGDTKLWAYLSFRGQQVYSPPFLFFFLCKSQEEDSELFRKFFLDFCSYLGSLFTTVTQIILYSEGSFSLSVFHKTSWIIIRTMFSSIESVYKLMLYRF